MTDPTSSTVPQSAQDLLGRFQSVLQRPNEQTDDAYTVNRNGRYMFWDGQSSDGRKWSARAGESTVVPWAGASDVRIPLVDVFCNERVALLVTALFRGDIIARAVESDDLTKSVRATHFLKWMLLEQMDETFAEACLLGNYTAEDGKSVMGIFWSRKTSMAYQDIDMEVIAPLSEKARAALAKIDEMAQIAAATGQPAEPMEEDMLEQLQALANFPNLVLDPAQEDAAVEVLVEQAEELVEANFAAALGDYAKELLDDYELPTASARRVVRELREEGKSRFPVPTVTENRPRICALKYGVDVFYDNPGCDIEAQQLVYRLEWLSETELKSRSVTHGWDEGWVQYVLNHGRGRLVRTLNDAYASRLLAFGYTDRDYEDLFPVIHCYQRMANDDGVVELRCRVISPCQSPGYKDMPEFAYDELLNYAHGQMPFVHDRHEYLSRRLDDSRGFGEVGYTWQQAIKTEIDMQRDRSMLATNPPLHHPPGRPPSQWGPGARVPASANQYFYADIPPKDSGSTEVVQHISYWAHRWFASIIEGVDPNAVAMLRQFHVDRWLRTTWKKIVTQVYQLCQQFMPDQFWFRVVGGAQGQGIRASREDIQGKFDLSLGFDVADLDPEAWAAKLAAIQQVVAALDINGIIDRDELLSVVLASIDPNIAERILKPAENARQAEIEDEQNVFARIWSGQEVDVKPGQAYQLRLQTMEKALMARDDQTGEPINPEGLQRYQQDEAFKKRVDKRRQQLQFQLQQRQNAVIGRLGA